MFSRANILFTVLALTFVQLPLVAYSHDSCVYLFDENSAAVSFAFDIDDNILFMPTQIKVFHKSTGKEVGISTTEFAEVKKHISIQGKYKDYKMLPSLKTGSLRYFGDEMTPDQFYNDLKWALDNLLPEKWQGPSWKAFQRAMSNYDTAQNTVFITARLHAPENILKGFKLLQEHGWILFLPRVENIFPVSNPNFQQVVRFSNIQNGVATDPAGTKAEVMKAVLDELNSRAMSEKVNIVGDPDSNGSKRLRTWGFSDDDYDNYAKAVKVLTEEVANGRWPNIKIFLFYTGHMGPIPMETKIIKSDGTLRDLTKDEFEREIRQLAE